MARVVLIDDHSVVTEAIASLLSSAPDLVVVGQATNGQDARALVSRTAPDIAVVDVRVGEEDGIALMLELRALCPQLRVVILTMHPTSSASARSATSTRARTPSPGPWSAGWSRSADGDRDDPPARARRRKSRPHRPASSFVLVVGVTGFEPTTPASRRQCSTKLSYTPNVLGRWPAERSYQELRSTAKSASPSMACV